MPVLTTLPVVVSVIAIAWACGRLGRRIGQPPVIGELAAGIALGPTVFGALAPQWSAAVFSPQVIAMIAEVSRIAVLIFMFLVGLELKTTTIRENAKGVIRIAVFSMVVPFAMGILIAIGLPASLHGAVENELAFVLFIGTAMSITALPVLARILADLDMMTTKIGTISLGCAAINDIAAWTMLGLVTGLVRDQGNYLAGIAVTGAYVLGMLFVVRPFLRVTADRIRAQPLGRALWMALVIAVAIASTMVSEEIGVHAVFGMFIAGACMPRRSAKGLSIVEGIERPLQFASAFVLPAFFVLIGLKTRIGLLAGASHWAIAVAILACAFVGKLGASSLAARSAGYSWREALAIGALLNTRGLVELVALDIGRELGVLSPILFAMLVIMTFVTTLSTVPLVRSFAWPRRGLPSE